MWETFHVNSSSFRSNCLAFWEKRVAFLGNPLVSIYRACSEIKIKFYQVHMKINVIWHCFITFSRDAKIMLDCLKPMFKVDYLLPRSLIAALNYEQFVDVVPTGLIPTEVTLAGIYFFAVGFHITQNDQVIKGLCESVCLPVCMWVISFKFKGLVHNLSTKFYFVFFL